MDDLLEKLVQERKTRGLTQSQLADLAGVSRRALQEVERGGDTSVSTLGKLCAAMQMELTFSRRSAPTLDDLVEENRRLFARAR